MSTSELEDWQINMTKTTKLSKSKQKTFTKKFSTWIEGKGAVLKPSEDGCEDISYSLKTDAGMLDITLYAMFWYGYEVFCEFQGEVSDLAIQVGANPHSGKWNHSVHDSGESVDSAFETITGWIELVLPREASK